MLKNGIKYGREARVRVPEVISFGPLGRPAFRRRFNTRFMAAGSAFLVAGVFLLVALVQPLSRDGAEPRLGPSVALAETLGAQTRRNESRGNEAAGPLDPSVAAIRTGARDAASVSGANAAGEEFEVAAIVALNDAARFAPVRRSMTVAKGGTLMKSLIDAGTERSQAHQAIAALQKVFDPRRLQVGQEILILLQPTDTGTDRLLSVTLPLSAEREVAAVRADDGSFVPDEINKPLLRELVRVEGEINESLFLATSRAGVPLQVVMDTIRIFSWEVDFQRDIQKGDQFQFMFERFFDESGNAVKDGNVVFASLRLSGKDLRLYRHTLEDGSVGYFDAGGQSARRALLKTPVDGARLSSGFGRRKHPILGYTKMHRGVDFAAPRGTNIVAAGDGVVEYAGRNGAYGIYIRIRHNGTYKTAYAHMQRIAKGVRSGTRVRQGQVIGYVGSTGRSTGPHAHYEVIRGGRQINPMKLRLPVGNALAGGALDVFQKHRGDLDSLFAGTPPLYQTAGN